MKILLALVMSAALAPAAYAHPARDLTEAGISGAVVLSHRGVDAAGDVTTQTRFRVGSITKTFVATVTLQLVAEGRLSLDEPVPEAAGAPLRTLLNHTSGIYNHSDDPRVFEHGLLTRRKPEQLIGISREHPRYFAPGAGLHYFNNGFGLFKVQASCGVTAWGHNGAVPGFLAHAYVSGRRTAIVLIDDEPATEHQEIAVNRVIDAALCS